MVKEVLLIPNKPDIERDEIANEWIKNGGEVKRIGKFWIKPAISNHRISIYGYDTFCLVLAQILELEMISVKDEAIAEIDQEYLKRNIKIRKLNEWTDISFPIFIKPVVPKLFKAQIFQSKEALQSKTIDIESNQTIICSEIIQVQKEVRAFILNKKVIELAFYEGKGETKQPKDFLQKFLNNTLLELPKTFVIDIGYNSQNGWFIIEFNSTWGAGLNFCNPSKVIDCIREATIN